MINSPHQHASPDFRVYPRISSDRENILNAGINADLLNACALTKLCRKSISEREVLKFEIVTALNKVGGDGRVILIGSTIGNK